MYRRLFLVLGLALLLTAAALVAYDFFAPVPVAAQDGGEEECPDGSPCPAWIVEAWAGSAHADAEAEAFVHWDADDPAEVPVSCAKCHSEGGYLDYLGADESEAGVVDQPAAIGSVVSCTVCHNPVAAELDTVMFPSGVELTDLGSSARCMVCHQGRESTTSVNQAIEESGLELDEPSADLGFINIHYFAAASSLYGSEVHGGYEFEGMTYQPKNDHVEGYATCAGCHDTHSLEVKVNECAACHTDVAAVEDLRAIRMPGSLVDYDGDGSIDEGIYAELEGMQEILYQAMQSYAAEVAGQPLVYSADRYPYFFADANGNGEIEEEDGRYESFTPRLLQAAYNFQAYEKDPGAYAHNPAYYAELLYDSIMTLNEQLAEPMELAIRRDPHGHFDATAEAFRHWDEDGEVPATCTKCHTSEGLPFFLENGVSIAFEPSDSLSCSTCHASFEDFSLYEVTEVTFPSGAVLGFEEDLASNLCLNCHQGRESTVSVNEAIAQLGLEDDVASEELGFRNVHYFAAGATLFGTEAKGVYEYEGKEYVGRNLHAPGMETCASCHSAHQLTVDFTACQACHLDVESPEEIRMLSGDWDGDAATEGVAGEIETLTERLLAAIQNYAATTLNAPIVYSPSQYPYFFADTNGNGELDADEAAYNNSYAAWSPTLLRAAYNYQYALKDPGAYVHNARYVGQVLYDSIEAVGGAEAVEGLTRP